MSEPIIFVFDFVNVIVPVKYVYSAKVFLGPEILWCKKSVGSKEIYEQKLGTDIFSKIWLIQKRFMDQNEISLH